MPRPIEATIVAGNLYLSDGGYTEADHGVSIFWVIRDNGHHPSIVSITGKLGSDDIFTAPPHPIGSTPSYCSRWLGVIDMNAPYNSEYIYSILVRDDRGTYPLDPKIAVKPSPIRDSLIRKIEKNSGLLLTAIISLIFLQILRRKRK